MANDLIYSVAQKGSFADKASMRARRCMYETLAKRVDLGGMRTVLDVGVTADQGNIASNFFEKLYPYPERITALSDQDASWMENVWPGLTFIQGDALAMPFADNSFDLVFSSAVIEHVGGDENQGCFLHECFRVAKKHVFLTTPNRFHPVEFHTGLPFIHWLPKSMHRALLGMLGKSFFASEEHLNLLTANDLPRLLAAARINAAKSEILSVRFGGFVSNLLLLLTKDVEHDSGQV